MPYLHLKLNFKNKITTKNKVRKKKKRTKVDNVPLFFFFFPELLQINKEKTLGTVSLCSFLLVFGFSGTCR